MSRNIAAAVRVVAGRRSVETDFSQALVDRNHCLDNFFDAKEVMMKEKPKKKKNKPKKSKEKKNDEVKKRSKAEEKVENKKTGAKKQFETKKVGLKNKLGLKKKVGLRNPKKSQPSSAAALDEFGYKEITIVGVSINRNLPYLTVIPKLKKLQ